MINSWWQQIKSRPLESLFLGYLALSQLYYSYRYILGYNSTFTSPTSKNTPPEFQAGKYILTAIFYLAVLAIIFARQEHYRSIWRENFRRHRQAIIIIALTAGYLILSLLKFNLSLANYSFSQLIKELFFVPVAAVPLLFAVDRGFLGRLFKLIVASLIFQVISFGIVYLLLVTTGRLPALASANDLIRFGGLWDDPNALALYLTIPLLVVVGLTRRVYDRHQALILAAVAATTALIYFTLSLTLWIALLVGLIALVAIRRDRISLVSVSVIAVFIILNAISPYSKNFVEYKISSLGERVCSTISVKNQTSCLTWFKDHFRSGTLFHEFTSEEGSPSAFESPVGTEYSSNPAVNAVITTVLGRRGSPTFSENIYLSTFLNFGLIGLGLLVVIVFLALKRALQLLRSRDELEKSLGLLGFVFLIIFSVGELALPYLAIYPVGLYFWLVITTMFAVRSE